MKMIDRVSTYNNSFTPPQGELIYVRAGGNSPDTADDYHFPQPTSCLIRRLLTGTYIMRRDANIQSWPVSAPQYVAVVELKGERMCFHVRNLLFFTPELRLRTIVDAQMPWMCFESPFITCIEGHGHVAFLIKGEPRTIARDANSTVPEDIRLSRWVAWAADTKVSVRVKPGWKNAVTAAPGSAFIRSTSLMLGAKQDTDVASDLRIWSRFATLIGI